MKTPQLHNDSIPEIVEIIGIQVEDWKGNCYGISCLIVEKLGMTTARAVYGHYHGPIAPTSMFDSRSPIVRHGWIVTEDGVLIDPTRWVFEDVEPYLYLSDETDEDYDEAGDAWRQAHNDQQPAPAFDGDRPVELVLPGAAGRFLGELLPDSPIDYPNQEAVGITLSLRQLFWVANLSMHRLGVHAEPIYRELIATDNEALIPIDNQAAVLG